MPNTKRRINKILSIFVTLFLCINLCAQNNEKIKGPIEYVYDSTKTTDLKAYIFFPNNWELNNDHSAMVIFHGGGWNTGDPSWGFGLAKKYAEKGMLTVTVQYRLSDQKSVTPLDAMEDACNVILWVRNNSNKLRIKRNRIVAYGWSAGAHLAASTAVFQTTSLENDISSTPNALILTSPALSLGNDKWFEQLLLNKANSEDYSPAEHLRENMPPSIILVGKDDSVTPVYQSMLFQNNMLRYNNESYLYIYDGVGHLFTPTGQPDDGWPKPDKKVKAKVDTEIELFLIKLKFIDKN